MQQPAVQPQPQTPYCAWRANTGHGSICKRCHSLSAHEVEAEHELCCSNCGAVLGPTYDQRENNRFDVETEADKSRHGMAEDRTLSSSANLSIRIGGGINMRGNGGGGGWRKRSLQSTAVWSLAISAADRRQIQINKHIGEIATLMQLGPRIQKTAKTQSVVERHATPGKAQRLSAKQVATGALFRACELLRCPRGVAAVADAAECPPKTVLRAARLLAAGARTGFKGKPPTAARAAVVPARGRGFGGPPSSARGQESVELLRCIGSINRAGHNLLAAPAALIQSTLKLARVVWDMAVLEGCMPHTVAAAAYKVASERSSTELGLPVRPQDSTKTISDVFGISQPTLRRAAKVIRDNVALAPGAAAANGANGGANGANGAAGANGGGAGGAGGAGAFAMAAVKVEPAASSFAALRAGPTHPTPPQASTPTGHRSRCPSNVRIFKTENATPARASVRWGQNEVRYMTPTLVVAAPVVAAPAAHSQQAALCPSHISYTRCGNCPSYCFCRNSGQQPGQTARTSDFSMFDEMFG